MSEALVPSQVVPVGPTGPSLSSSGSEDGRALLQERLGLFGKAAFLVDLL